MIIIQTLISISVAVISCLIGILGYKRTLLKDKTAAVKEMKSETQEDVKEKVQQNAKLDVLLSNNTEIKGSLRDLDKKFDKFKDETITRLTRVEESCKQAHKRIDALENKK